MPRPGLVKHFSWQCTSSFSPFRPILYQWKHLGNLQTFIYVSTQAAPAPAPWSIVSQHDAKTEIMWPFFKKVPQLSMTHRFAFSRRENVSEQIEAAGWGLVWGGRVSVAGGGRPRGIGGEIQGQRHRWDRAAEPHQGNAGVRAAHRWGKWTSHFQRATSSVPCSPQAYKQEYKTSSAVS